MMKRWILASLCLVFCSSSAWGQDWALDRFPMPIVAQPGEEIALTLTGPDGGSATLLMDETTLPVSPLGEGRYASRFLAPQTGSHTLTLKADGKVQEIGELRVESGTRTFTASGTVVTRQGPDSDFDRLTPLVRGAVVAVDGSRGEWHRSHATGAWLDGRSGTLSDQPFARPRLSRIMVEAAANGDALLKLSCGSLPEASAVYHPDGRFTLTLADTEHMVFDITKPSSAANFLDSINVRPNTRPFTAIVEITAGKNVIGGYEMEPGTVPGELVLRLRKPVLKSMAGLNITLDAGHGGPEDPGTMGHGGLAEKVLNLRVTEELQRQLVARGATVFMTRTTDADVATDEQGATNELQARIDASVAHGSHLFLSLHHNARPDVEEGKISHGTDVYWYQPVSEGLGRALADPIADAIGEPLRTSRYRSFHVIRQTFSPSVLIEFQYLSNPQLEKDVLTRADYPKKAAAGVVKGLEAYLRQLP